MLKHNTIQYFSFIPHYFSGEFFYGGNSGVVWDCREKIPQVVKHCHGFYSDKIVHASLNMYNACIQACHRLLI